MHGKIGPVLVVCILAGAAGGGIWAVNRVVRRPAPAPTPPLALAETPIEPTPPRMEFVAPSLPPQAPTEPEPRAESPAPDSFAGPGPRDWSDEDRERMREEFMRRFDTNGDGELSDQEREAVRAQFDRGGGEDMRRMALQRYDTDGDGELSREERDVARSEMRELRNRIMSRIMPLYDSDGDGRLNESERDAAGPAIREQMERVRTFASLDTDRTGAIEAYELAQTLVRIGSQDTNMDFNRDGAVDYQDAAFAVELSKSGI